jgi:flagellar hook-length control protein FliK
VSPFNFLETKIDVPALDRKLAPRAHEAAPQDDSTDFDRMVAEAAEGPKVRDGTAKENTMDHVSDAATGDGDTAAIATLATTDAADTAAVQTTPDASLAAAVVAVLLPVSENSIWLPANIGTPAAQTAIAANMNLLPSPQADVAAGEPLANALPTPTASTPAASVPTAGIQVSSAQAAYADFAATVADLFEMDPSLLEAQAHQNISAVPQITQATAAVTKGSLQLATAPAKAANSDALAAAPQLPAAAVAGGVGAESTPAATAPTPPKDAPASKPAAGDAPDVHIDAAAAPTSKPDPVAMPMARDFVREVATQYQATADAGSSSRSAENAAPAEQISIRLIHSLHEGRKAMQIHLHPSELGSIEVSMQWKGDRLTAHFVVDRPETLDLIQRDIRILEQSLGDSGFKSDNGGLSFSLRQQTEGQSERRSGNGSPSSDRTQNAAPENPADEPSIVRDGVLVLRV